MPPQIDQTLSSDQTENIEKSLPDYNPNVLNIQKHLLILLYIQWFICVLALGIAIYFTPLTNTADISSGIQPLIPIIVVVLYYIFGLLVTYKQHRIGLLIFAWIGVLLFIGLCILAGYIIVAILALGVVFGSSRTGYEFIVFIGVLFAVIAIIPIFSLKFSFNLAKLIKTNEYATV